MTMINDWRLEAKNSLSTRFTGEVIKHFSGDEEAAMRCMPLARTILGEVKNKAALSGIGYASRQVSLNDGTTITAIVNNGIYTILIDAPPPKPEEPGSYGGFVFYPQINRLYVLFDNYYPPPKLNATLSVSSNGKDRVRLQVDAPVNFIPNGNRFAFLGQDVYAWVHQGTGDGPGSLYGAPYIYKNNILYEDMSLIEDPIGGIVGLHPYRWQMPDKTHELRFLVAANTGTGSVQLRAYAMRSGEMVLLNGSKTLLDSAAKSYYSSRWPVKFNGKGTRCATIASYFEETQVTANPGSGAVMIDTYRVFHEVIECIIEHLNDGISVSVSASIRGVPHILYMHEIYNRHTEYHSRPLPVSAITNPPYVPGDCSSLNIDYSGTFSEELIDTYSLDRRLNKNHPIALDYRGDSLEIWDYEEDWDVGIESNRTYNNGGTFTCLDVFEGPPEGPCREVVRKLMTWAGNATEVWRSTRKNIHSYKVNGVEIFRSDQSSRENVTSSGSYIYVENGGAQGEPTPIHENPTTRTDVHDSVTRDGNGTLVAVYFNVKDNVIVATSANSGWVTTREGEHVTERSTSSGTSFTWSGTYETHFEIARECQFRLHGKKVNTDPQVQPDFSEQGFVAAASLFAPMVNFVFPDASTGYVVDESYDTYRDPPVYELVTGTVEFSYVSDPRVRGDNLAWMYSLHYWDTERHSKNMGPINWSKCTWGNVGPMLPNNEDGKGIYDDNLVIFPIALF